MKIIKNNLGFTMVEMIVSIGIVAMIAGIFLANYRGSDRSNQLNLAAEELASNIRLAQSYSLGLVEFEGVTPGAWGVNLKTGDDYYIIFADSDLKTLKTCIILLPIKKFLLKRDNHENRKISN